jgi:tRNA pseudouridine55 synthase
MTGEILREADYACITRQQFESVLKQFAGHLTQIPPMYSAIKRDGQPLYKLARQGQVVEREPRNIVIYSLQLLSFSPPFVGFRVACSRGTYVRTLADDMGHQLGCGAALKELRRIASGPFEICSAVSLEGLEEAVRHGAGETLAISPNRALSHLPEIVLSDSGRTHVSHGRSPGWDDTEFPPVMDGEYGSGVRLSYNGFLVAVAELRRQGSDVARIVLKRVFM